MRPVFVAWLVRHGWPAWFCPDYATMTGFATIVSAILVLRLAARDGAKTHVQARAMLATYLGALVGGYLFEWIRMVPNAIAAGSLAPILFAGRAAYGGLIFGTLAGVLYLWRTKQRVLDYCDRAVIALGICFACVRFGCFLEGCDFGEPTASWVGVRFPGGSLASHAHAALGWIPAGAESLPVHPTQLYECGVGVLATLLALVPLRKGRRDGAAFATWLVTYAVGRFAIELLRGDAERGHYAALTTAQWVSVAILAGVYVAVSFRHRAKLSLAVSTVVVFLIASPPDARAEPPLPPAPAQPSASAPPSSAPASTAAPSTNAPAPAPASSPKEGPATNEPAPKIATVRLALASSLSIARPDVPSGWLAEVDLLYRLRLGRRTRLDVGLEGRRYENVDAIHVSVGVAGEFVFEVGRHFEVLFTFVPHHTWFDFKSDYFEDTNAYGVRYAFGCQFPIGPAVLGVTPLAFATTSNPNIGVLSQWEPRLWAGFSF